MNYQTWMVLGGDDGWTSKNLQSSVLFFVDLISYGDELLVFCFGHDRAAMFVNGTLQPPLV